jgi:hypothetical protein
MSTHAKVPTIDPKSKSKSKSRNDLVKQADKDAANRLLYGTNGATTDRHKKLIARIETNQYAIRRGHRLSFKEEAAYNRAIQNDVNKLACDNVTDLRLHYDRTNNAAVTSVHSQTMRKGRGM